MKNTDFNALPPPDYYNGLTKIINFHTKLAYVQDKKELQDAHLCIYHQLKK